ncbi:hypothetical protein [Rufibacter roseus]|uniref:Energy transducer TonB n=1 Tax=Rufibacter roseus TaxID=1567108 RepID=A0ABW2DQ60_9BACT|nr:hypothetical protein [Rufibacter roseus]
MIAVTPQEQKNKRIAAGVSLAIHILLLLFLFWMLVWQEENPPQQIGGIEMSFGTTDAGGGEVHSKATPNESKNTEDSRPPAEAEKVTPQPEVVPVTQPTPQPQVEKVVTTSQESPVVVKEEPKPQPKPEPKEEVKKVDSRAMMPVKSKDGGGNGTDGKSNNPTGNNNGEEGKTGDKGNPAGLYPGTKTGAGGSGGGPLNMPGWRFDLEPRTDPYNNETGKVVFQVKIDADGEIIALDVMESNVSAKVVNWYRSEVRKTSFSRIRNGGNNNEGATGTITFIIRSR